MSKKTENDIFDESLRRLGGILASPSLVTSYQHTTPLLEQVWLRRAGLSKSEAEEFLALLCQHGLMDVGARAVVEQLCRRQRVMPKTAVEMLLAGEGWPEEES